MTSDKLIFGFNAKSGVLNGLIDSVHKILSPTTYSCDLCAITHHSAGMKKELKRFLEGLNVEVIFIHKEDVQDYPRLSINQLPFIGKLKHDNSLEILIDKDEIAQTKHLEALLSKIQHVK